MCLEFSWFRSHLHGAEYIWAYRLGWGGGAAFLRFILVPDTLSSRIRYSAVFSFHSSTHTARILRVNGSTGGWNNFFGVSEDLVTRTHTIRPTLGERNGP